jgi:nucleoside-diphosphate-sugar epimerase
VVVDVFDADALRDAVVSAAPDIVIHQLTDLPAKLDPAAMEEASRRNAHIRETGTAHLMAAAEAAGVTRVIAQSIAFVYAPLADHPTGGPIDEGYPLDLAGVKARPVSVQGVVALERSVLGSATITGIVLRYGRLYGPGTGVDEPPSPSPLHVDAAAKAAALAVTRGAAGLYNIAEDDGVVSSEKAKRTFGWTASFRL